MILSTVFDKDLALWLLDTRNRYKNIVELHCTFFVRRVFTCNFAWNGCRYAGREKRLTIPRIRVQNMHMLKALVFRSIHIVICSALKVHWFITSILWFEKGYRAWRVRELGATGRKFKYDFLIGQTDGVNPPPAWCAWALKYWNYAFSSDIPEI